MKIAALKPHIFRALLFFHFLGLAATLGAGLGTGVIDSRTITAPISKLLLGRSLIDALQRTVILPGFLIILATGAALTFIRYGIRPPLWVWIKVGLVAATTGIAVLGVAPAAAAAQQWARWSAEHGQIAPQLLGNLARSRSWGNVVRALFVITIGVAIWKPFGAAGRRKLKSLRSDAQSTGTSVQHTGSAA